MKVQEWFTKVPAFLKDVRMEVKKTSFPSRSEVVNTTLVVIVVVAIFGAYLWIVDQVVFSAVQKLFQVFR